VLTVVSVGYPFAPCGPDAVGGAEQILSAIDAALVDAGHRSIVIAPEGSICRGELRTTPGLAGTIDDAMVHACHESCREHLRRVLRDDHVDLIHFHGTDVAQYLPDVDDVPMLVTLHLWPAVYPDRLFRSGRSNVHLQCVSEAQRRACPPAARPLLIRNGVNLRELVPREPKDGFILALGRICPEKGFHLAMDGAKAAGMPMLIGGVVFPYDAHQRYFEESIAPRLDDQRRFLGPLNRRTTQRLLAAARCVVVPSTIPETSSLVAMEALACGTAVVAARTPALEELIDDGETGLLVDSPSAMGSAFRRVGDISPAVCRRAAERRCSAEQMTAEYLSCYERLAHRHHPTATRAAQRPVTVDVITSIDDLASLQDEWTAVARDCPLATPFQHPEWLLPWMRHLMRGALMCVAIRRGERLVGLIPLTRSLVDGRIVLELAGGGVSDYLGAVVRSDEASAVCSELTNLLGAMRDWDAIDMRQLQRDDPLMMCDGPWRASLTREPDPSPALARGAVPRHMSSNLRYYRRKAERLGALALERATAASVTEMVAALYQLHAARWSSRGSPGVLADPAIQAFHSEAMPAMHRAGLLSLHALRIDRRVVAIAYCLASGTRGYYYLGGFDPSFAHVSPGTLVLGEAIDAAWRDGATEFEFLRGREPYKYLWGAVNRATFRRQLTR
jgi:CelD/BcsL family acetyltransferase involved in cellulose biosynthesis/glycosyltransferase involved in cell wall biosynthesis